jgi:hypothetical protein
MKRNGHALARRNFLPARDEARPARAEAAFETALERWLRGDDLSWGELFAAWVKMPTASRSRDTVWKVIRRVEWMG